MVFVVRPDMNSQMSFRDRGVLPLCVELANPEPIESDPEFLEFGMPCSH